MDPDKREDSDSDSVGNTPPHCEYCAMHGSRCGDQQLVTTEIDVGMALVGCAAFECAFAVTGSIGVVLAQSGPYAPVSTPGEAFPMAPGQITLRVRPENLHASVIARSDGERRELMVELSAFGGHPVHLVRVASEFDTLVMDGLARSAGEGLTENKQSLPQVFIGKKAISSGRSMRSSTTAVRSAENCCRSIMLVPTRGGLTNGFFLPYSSICVLPDCHYLWSSSPRGWRRRLPASCMWRTRTHVVGCLLGLAVPALTSS